MPIAKLILHHKAERVISFIHPPIPRLAHICYKSPQQKLGFTQKKKHQTKTRETGFLLLNDK